MNKKSAIMVALMLSGLTACGDDDTSSENSGGVESSSYSVTAIDGYLRGAQVWLDVNDNFKLDEGEPTGTTGEGGKIDLDTTGIDNPEQYSVFVKAIVGETIDEDSISDDNPDGVAVEKNYVMSAPAGESAVTPLSTLVHVLVKKNSSDNATPEQIEQIKKQAIATVAAQLGVSEDDILGDFIESNKTDLAFVAQNLVAANVFPEDENGLIDAVSDSSTESSFSKKASAVSSFIKKKVVEIKSNPEKSFEDENPLFDEKTDLVSDRDGDEVADLLDAFPDDPKEWVDTDGDGIGDNSDEDIDGDGVANELDLFPFDETESADLDGDGIGDNRDTDRDGDGVLNTQDAFPNDRTESKDTDKDGYGDNGDAFPNDPAEWFDTDGDGVGNNADAFPDDATETVDTDNDGIGDNADISPLDKNYFVHLRSYDKQLTVVGATEQPVVERGVLTTQANGDSVWVYLPMTQAQPLADFPDVSFDATSDAQTFMNLYMLVVPDTDGLEEFTAANQADNRHFKLKNYGPEGHEDPNKYVEIRLYQGESLNDLLVANNIDKSKFIVPVYHDAPAGTGTDTDYEAKGNFFLRFGDSNYTGFDDITLNRFSFEPTYQLMEEGGKFVTTASQVNGDIEMLPYGNARIQSNGASVWIYSQLDHTVPLEEIGDFSFDAYAEDEEEVTGAIFANVYVKVKSDITPEALAHLDSVASPNAWMPIRKTDWVDEEGDTIYVFSLKESTTRVLSQLLRNNGLSMSDFLAVPYYYESGDRESVGDAVTRGNFYVRFGDSRYNDSHNFYLTRYSFTPVHQFTVDSAPFVTTAAVTNATVDVKDGTALDITTGGDSVWAYTPIDREQPLTDFADFMFIATGEGGQMPTPDTFANVYLTSSPDITPEKLGELDGLPSQAGSEMRNPNWELQDGRDVYVVTIHNMQSLTATINAHGFQRSDFHVLPFYDAPAGTGSDTDPEAKGNFFVRIGDSEYTDSGDKVTLSHYSFEPFYMLQGGYGPLLSTATQTGATIGGYGNPNQIEVTANRQSVWFYHLLPGEMPLSYYHDFSFTMTSTAASVSGGMFANVYLMPNSEQARSAFLEAEGNDSTHFQELTYGPEEGNYLKINIYSGEALDELLEAQQLSASDYTVVVYHDGANDGDPEAKGNFFIRTGDSGYTGRDTFTLSFNRANVDSDGDEVNDYFDAFPEDPSEWVDNDGDGYGDNLADAFPEDKLEWLDTDGDLIGDNSDPDRDGDGVLNENDAFDLDATEWADSDGDGVGNNADAFPYDSTKLYANEKLAYDTFFGGQQVRVSTENNIVSFDDSSGYFTGTTAGESVWFLTPFPQELVDAGYRLSAVPDFSFAVNQSQGEAFSGTVFANIYVTPYDYAAYERIVASGKVQTNGGAPLRDTNWNTEKEGGVITSDPEPELDTYVITVLQGETLNDVMKNLGIAKSDFKLLSFTDSPRAEDGDQEAVDSNFILKLGSSNYTGSEDFIVDEYSFTPKYTIGNGPELVIGDAVNLAQDEETGAVTGESYGQRIFAYVPMGMDAEAYAAIAPLTDYQSFEFVSDAPGSFVNIYVVAKDSGQEQDLITLSGNVSGGTFSHVTWAKNYQPQGKEVFTINMTQDYSSLQASLAHSGLDIEDFDVIAYVDGGQDGDPAAKGNFVFKNGGNGTTSHALSLSKFEY